MGVRACGVGCVAGGAKGFRRVIREEGRRNRGGRCRLLSTRTTTRATRPASGTGGFVGSMTNQPKRALHAPRWPTGGPLGGGRTRGGQKGNINGAGLRDKGTWPPRVPAHHHLRADWGRCATTPRARAVGARVSCAKVLTRASTDTDVGWMGVAARVGQRGGTETWHTAPPSLPGGRIRLRMG